MRIGVLGGTFNPPHLAHLICASEAADQLALHRVLLMPVASAPHKEIDEDPGAEERLRLCELAAAGDERLEVSRLEIDRGGPSYTVDTLRELHDQAPDQELTFIVGGDIALGLPSWREPEAVLGLARLGVAERAGAPRRDVAERIEEAFGPQAGARVDFFSMPRVDISSSLVRRRVAAGRSIRHLVPAAVAERVAHRGLYR